MFDFAQARDRMVEDQILRRGIRTRPVLDAMRRVPRELFVQPGCEEVAYSDGPLPIGAGQTLSQPYIVALMIEAADIARGDRVLDVGAGSGYAAAVASCLADRVYAVERIAALGAAARRRLRDGGYDNVDLRVGDGAAGWPEAAPFDAILVAAAAPTVPIALKRQLVLGGWLVVPTGAPDRDQALLKVTRRGESAFAEDHLAAVRFVPLVTGAP